MVTVTLSCTVIIIIIIIIVMLWNKQVDSVVALNVIQPLLYCILQAHVVGLLFEHDNHTSVSSFFGDH